MPTAEEEEEEEAAAAQAAVDGSGGGLEVSSNAVAATEALIAAHASRLNTGGTAGGNTDLVKRAISVLDVEVGRLQHEVSTSHQGVDETQRLLEGSATAIKGLDSTIQGGLLDFDFLQRAQAYCEDLLDCLNETEADCDRQGQGGADGDR